VKKVLLSPFGFSVTHIRQGVPFRKVAVVRDQSLRSSPLARRASVVHIPVHDGRKMQLPEMSQLKADCATSEMHVMRHLNQTFQSDAFKGYRMPAAKRV
jgi:hypothetical protein